MLLRNLNLQKIKELLTPFNIVCGLILFVAIWLRFYKLGYPESFGDEINGLKYLKDYKGINPSTQEFFDFLMVQNRGPGQYLVNYINTSIFGYVNEFQIRFPFTIFSIAAIYTVYLLAKEFFEDNKNANKLALISAVFIAVNGLYISFSKVAQYQSFIYAVIPFALVLFHKGYTLRKTKYIIFSAFLLSTAILFHYDVIVSLIFIGFYWLYTFLFKKGENLPKLYNLKIISIFTGVFLILPVWFYSQLVLHSYFQARTENYLSDRIWDGGLLPNTPYMELGKVLSIYMPFELWHIFVILIVIGMLINIRDVGNFNIFKFKINEKLMKSFYILSVIFFYVAFIISIYPIKPKGATLVIYATSLSILGLLILSKKIKPIQLATLAYWLISFSLYFFFLGDPRTHVYVSFIPAFIIAAQGYWYLFTGKYTKYATYFLTLVFIIYLGAFYKTIYLDKGEYPWERKYLFNKPLTYIDRSNPDGNVQGIFGFSNYRHWKEIRDLYDKGCLVGTYNSNEKEAVTEFYLAQTSKDGPDSWRIPPGSDNMIHVLYPSLWSRATINQIKRNDNYTLLKVYYNANVPVTYIYGDKVIYPEGKLLCE